MRIVSLLPAATEWICAFGGTEDLVGRSHGCDYPPSVAGTPIVTRSTLDSGRDAARVDQAVRRSIREGLSLYEVDMDRLEELAPDIVITQDQCEVCAVSLDEVEAALQSRMSVDTQLISFAPLTLKQVLDGALRIGRAIGRLEAAMQFIAAAEQRLQQFMGRLGIDRHDHLQGKQRPSVLCVEWIEPLMAAGHWTSDVVEKAGGSPVLGREAQPSHYVSWEDVVGEDPDVLAFIPCGYDVSKTRENLQYCTERRQWTRLSAVREDRVFLFDGSSYFNRPGPRLYRSIELMGASLHPDRITNLDPPPRSWEVQRVSQSSPTSVT